MEYLTQLETWIVLRPDEEEWQLPPTVPPPPYTPSPIVPLNVGWDLSYPHTHPPPPKDHSTFTGMMIPSQVPASGGAAGAGTNPPATTTATATTTRRPKKSTPARPLFKSNNPFASIALDDDDDDDEENSNNNENVQTPNHEDEEAGDLPVLNHPHPESLSSSSTAFRPRLGQGGTPAMTLLRLMIRIRTSTGDLWAYQSKGLADAHRWTEACVALVNAIAKSRDAMFLADDQISQYYFQRELLQEQQLQGQHHPAAAAAPAANTQLLLEALQQDADIVHVAVQSVVRVKDRYQELAEKQIQKLQRILRPQWDSRNQVRDRMGRERWTNNPTPKHDYSVLREESEEELKILQEALASLDEADVEALASLALAMKTRLQEGSSGSPGYRYNGKRPEELVEYPAIVHRLEGFPDATEYDWIFTGSNPTSSVEFFEKQVLMEDVGNSHSSNPLRLVKLDWYYTTATIKTSMDHPRQGKTQLFAKAGVTPDVYVQILENPRVHTDVQRYQRKQQQQPPSQQRNTNSSNPRNRNSSNNNNNNNNNNNGSSNNRGGRRGRGGTQQRRGPSKYAAVFGAPAAVEPAAAEAFY